MISTAQPFYTYSYLRFLSLIKKQKNWCTTLLTARHSRPHIFSLHSRVFNSLISLSYLLSLGFFLLCSHLSPVCLEMIALHLKKNAQYITRDVLSKWKIQRYQRYKEELCAYFQNMLWTSGWMRLKSEFS